MRILHIHVTGPYTDNSNYQENMLAKYQKKAGHEVFLIASQWEWNKDGKIVKYCGDSNYVNNDGIYIKRLPIKKNRDIFYRFKRFSNFYESIEEIAPDIIFVHNLQFFDIENLVKYAKTRSVKIFVDNHADFSNSARSKLAVIFYKIVWRYMAKKIEPYTTKFYGVLPARVNFLKKIYKLPEKKCELLVMGADDDEVKRAKNLENIRRIRKQFEIDEDDFLIVTGGKIDIWKTQTLLLMDAIKKINKDNVKLLIFGPVSQDIKFEFDKKFDQYKMRYVSWANIQQSYDYFAIADLVVFPGRHSVYWEQVIGQGKPMVCKYWEGTAHVDLGGNVEFLKEDSVSEIKEKIEKLIKNPEKLNQMKLIAEKKGMETFSYKKIAERALN